MDFLSVDFAMKDKQIFMADSDKVSEADRAYLLKKAEENHVMKKAIPLQTVLLICGVIVLAAAFIGWLI